MNRRRVCIAAYNFPVPWKPSDLGKFLGGTQECVVYLARTLKQNLGTCTIFMAGQDVWNLEEEDVRDIRTFRVEEFDTVILADYNPFGVLSQSTLKKIFWDKRVIYWSSTFRFPCISFCNAGVCLTSYHLEEAKKGKSTDMPGRVLTIPHGIDKESLDRNKSPREEDLMLYSSDPGRGLTSLLGNWGKIKKYFPKMRLVVTYGLEILKRIEVDSEGVRIKEEELRKICEQEDVTFLNAVTKDTLESLYWKAKYWVHPLNNATSELFCLNAVKSQYCGCIPIVNRIGALSCTVGDYIEFSDLCSGKLEIRKTDTIPPIHTWQEVYERYWRGIL